MAGRVREASRLDIALMVIMVLAVIATVWFGLFLVKVVIGSLGPVTACGLAIEMAQKNYARLPKCAAYARAIDEVATRPDSPCPRPRGSPPSAHGIYAKYLKTLGCPTHRG